MWGHLLKSVEHCKLRMLPCIEHDPNDSFKKSIVAKLSIRAFQHAYAVRCCAPGFNAHQRGTLEDILYFYYDAALTFQTCTRSDGHHAGPNKLRTFILKHRADDHCFQNASSSIWNNLPDDITRVTGNQSLITKTEKHYCTLIQHIG